MQLPLRQDPADRFIAATAQVLDLTLVTADQRLLGLGNYPHHGQSLIVVLDLPDWANVFPSLIN